MVNPAAKKKGILHDFYAPLANIGLKEAADETRRAFTQDSPIEESQQDDTAPAPISQTASDDHKETGSHPVTIIRIQGDTLAGLQGDRVTPFQGHRMTPSQGDMVTGLQDHRVTPSQGDSVTGLQGHRVTPSRGDTNSINRVLYPTQAAVLSALISLHQEGVQIYSRGVIASRAKSTKSGVDKALAALERKQLITKKIAYRHGTRGQNGCHISLSREAQVALLLSGYTDHQELQGVTLSGLQGDRGTGPQGDTLTGLQSDRITGSQGDTPICSSIFKKTTTTGETTSGEIEENFSQLILDDWGQWGLRPAAIQSFMAKPLALLQGLLDKTAYAIRQREGTDRPIQNKIGFLKTNLQNEFCDVDASFITREERIRKQRIEQLKRETERIKAAREEERDAAIELLSLQLSVEELSAIKQQAIKLIKDEIGSHMDPSAGVIASRARSILADLAKERGMFYGYSSAYSGENDHHSGGKTTT